LGHLQSFSGIQYDRVEKQRFRSKTRPSLFRITIMPEACLTHMFLISGYLRPVMVLLLERRRKTTAGGTAQIRRPGYCIPLRRCARSCLVFRPSTRPTRYCPVCGTHGHRSDNTQSTHNGGGSRYDLGWEEVAQTKRAGNEVRSGT
jgi:hypothetical protein